MKKIKKQTNKEVEEDVEYIFARAQLRTKPHTVNYYDRLFLALDNLKEQDDTGNK